MIDILLLFQWYIEITQAVKSGFLAHCSHFTLTIQIIDHIVQR